MSNGAASLSTAVESQVGAIRRSSISVNEAVQAVRTLNHRLEAIKARVQGINAEVATADDAPEPVRNDLEELDYQIAQLHAGLNVTSNHLDDVNGI